MIVKTKVLIADARLPVYATDGAACADLASPCELSLCPDVVTIINLGLAFEIPRGYEGLIRGRSSAPGNGFLVVPGTIDSDYRGPVGVQIVPLRHYLIEKGERIAQLAISPVMRANFLPSDVLSATARGDGGWGSTGR